MALTVKNLLKFRMMAGDFVCIIQVTGDTSYPNTGSTVGYPINAATFGLNSFAATSDYGAFAANSAPPTATAYWVVSNLAVSAGGTYSEPDATTGNLRMYAAGGTEISNTSTAVGNSAVLMAYGH